MKSRSNRAKEEKMRNTCWLKTQRNVKKMRNSKKANFSLPMP
jgi:hypothetical protein